MVRVYSVTRVIGLFIHSFIHSCMSAGVPKKKPSYIWGKHKVTVHGAPSRQKAYIHWGAAWFPKGIVLVLLYILCSFMFI